MSPKLPEYDDQILLFLLILLEEKSSITTSIFISSNFSFSMHNVARPFNLSCDIDDFK